ncbi:hypothetical protein FKW77_007950 [Venturia effusa]|uniref:Secreted protein n=1 Tax=Venturia effusa TaxID=50376 RepID=A0A517KWW4_9PEZI|nr:hypothetical protein FKW77_007950 [Venturia effusa]
MHITSYLATLLALAPATVYGKEPRCKQALITYRVKCTPSKLECEAGEAPLTEALRKDLAETASRWVAWTNIWENAGPCGGFCNAPYKKAVPPFLGSTWMMDCYAARMHNVVELTSPSVPPTIERDSEAQKCIDIPCRGPCQFVFGKC